MARKLPAAVANLRKESRKRGDNERRLLRDENFIGDVAEEGEIRRCVVHDDVLLYLCVCVRLCILSVNFQF